MWASVAKFELGYQLKSPTFWVCFIIFFLLGFFTMALPQVSILAGANVHKNAPIVITFLLAGLTQFYMFVTTAFGANIMIRDQETAFGPLLYSTRLKPSDYVYGRTAGAFAASALCLLSVPFGILIGSVMPWLDKDTLGPTNVTWYAWPYFLIALPTVLFTVAAFSSAATLTRSMMGSFLTTIAILVLLIGVRALVNQSDVGRQVYAWVDPFGMGAIAKVTRYWTSDESNTQLPSFTGVIVFNRLLYVALGIGLVVLTRHLVSFGTTGAKAEKVRETGKADAAKISRALAAPIARPRFGAAHAWQTFVVRTGFEVGQVFSGPVYPLLMLMAIGLTVLLTFSANQLYGTAIYPVTRVMVSVVSSGFQFFAVVVAIFYSGQIVWRERERRSHEIIDSTAIPSWAFIVPKTVALIIVLVSTLLASVVADVAVQIFKGYTNFEFAKYLLWLVLPGSLSFSLLAVLAIFVQALSPNKFVGWAVMVLWLIFQLFAGMIGFDHNLYMYGGAPSIPYSDMNGAGQFWIGWLVFKLYWLACAIMLLVIAHLMWRRGTVSHLTARLARIPQRLKSGAGAIFLVALIAFAGLGGYIFYNTNILNHYYTKAQVEKNQVAFEKAFTPVTGLAVPSVTHVTLKVDLYPHQLRLVSHGSYTLENKTAAPISEVYVTAPRELSFATLTLQGAHLQKDYPEFGVKHYVFDTPMQPGEQRTLMFAASMAQKGFGNDGITTRIVDNGTFVNNFEIAPRLGISDAQEMTDKALRRKYKLPPLKRMNSLEDARADNRNYIGADWTTSDITVSTVADQTPVAPGYKTADVTFNGRRTARYVSDVPILNFFSIQSAHYAEKHLTHDGVDLAVYYDAQHPYNVDDMLHAMASSLDYYDANFSPYQFRQARILEFPTYAAFAQSFANTIPYSEAIGFIADVRDPNKIDYTTYITAHELGHQWWAHQIIGADKEGAESLSESLAQYSALMVMEKLYGPDKIRRFLKYELDMYLLGRQTDPDEEKPLYREQHEDYIYYRKASLVMYLLKDRMGEDKVNAALRSLLTRYAFKGAPYPKSTDLVAALRAQASPDDQGLITDLFEKITLVDLRARDPKVVKRADGRYDVTFTVEAHKFYAAGKGKETETPLNEPIDIGVFTAKPGEGAFNARDVLSLARQPIHSGVQTVTVTVAKKPSYVGVDPYNKWIDRTSDDNVVQVGG